DDVAVALYGVVDAAGHRAGEEMHDRVGDADGNDLGEGGPAEVVVEGAVGGADAGAGQEGKRGGAVGGVGGGEGTAGVRGVVGVAVTEVALQVGTQVTRPGDVFGVVAGVENGDPHPPPGGVADAPAGRAQAGPGVFQVPGEPGTGRGPVGVH